MATSPDERKATLLEATVKRVHERVEGPDAADVERFVRAYYSHVAPDDLCERSDLDLCGAAVAHWELARLRRPGETKVRVYTPTVDEHGWESPNTVVETVVDDMPFLVDSVSMEVTRTGSAIHLVIRPIMRMRRDDEGRLLEVGSEKGLPESLIHVEIDRQAGPVELERLRTNLCRVLGDVRAAVEDWPAMLERVGDAAAELAAAPVDPAERAEARDLLQWMRDGHFTFLGYREYDMLTEDGEDVLRAVAGSGLGILRAGGEQPISVSFSQLPPEVRRLAREQSPLILTKANSRATVHRPSYLDYVGVKRFDESGEVAGERRFLGLYTHTAYSASPWEIPVLRRRAQRVVDRSRLLQGSHDHKALLDILETYPRDELFQISEDELFETALGILHVGERGRVRLFVRRDAFGRFFSCLVYLPRERFDTRNRQRIQEILQQAFAGTSVDYATRVSESVLARIHCVVYTEPGAAPEFDVGEIEARLAAATRAWTDDLRDALSEQLGEERAGPLFERYGEAFPGAYREDFSAAQAVSDVLRIERLDPDGDLGMSLYVPLEPTLDHLAFKLVRSGKPILLSDVLPLLENMGVRVSDERPYEVVRAGGPPVWIYDFGLRHDEGAEFQADDVREMFQDAFARAWRGESENDGFNRLVLAARLTAREITILRAIAKYLRQAGSTFSQDYMEDALAAHPDVALRLVRLFRLRLDPVRFEDTDAKARSLERELEGRIDAVESLDEDRILRGFLRVVRAVLRTNFFQTDAGGQAKPYLSLKLDPELVPDLPEPRPLYEVFVYSPRVEAVHLRAGKVARGGIRWSDRREDFRTEVLGLMKAQTVKNAVIVPTGAKGGFVVKRPPPGGDRAALGAEVVECYRTFMRGLLDVTDTIAGGEIVPPPDVVRHDDDDPYLVVAADKGTATFSDLANAVAHEYGFWLGDAFASGGSAGYDHKAIAITARGAWESVKRHFRELGTDIESTDFTAVGIGDMSGDVFGNGMLLSRHIRLIAAFDHRHVFLDPDPDAAASFAERERLFRLPGSSWADYDPALISAGGGAFPRTAKSIALSPEARAALGVAAEALPPSELIHALLCAPVDLLWNGGIGTYVKAREERHAEVGDRANDAVRVDAEELRCRVVGEGGNLGFTQRARIAYARGRGRIYMDAIDNSAGVDCSDHEVNIKVLLDTVVAEGNLTGEQRNAILAEMTDEVAALVLRDNYEQTQAIASSTAQAASMAEVHERYVRSLEQAGTLNRELECLPTDEGFDERQAAGAGLTAPEFATLLSHTKIALAQELLASELPEDPSLSGELERYFPTRLREEFADELGRHPLRREIIASRVANDLVNRAGTTFAFRLADETGAAADDIARAYTAAREVFGLRGLWSEVEALDGRVPAETQIAMLLRSRILLERSTRWLLRNRRRPLEIAATVTRYAPGAAALGESLPALLGPAELEVARERAGALAGLGVPPELAGRAAYLEGLVPALDLVEVAAAAQVEIAAAAEVYFALGARLELHWLRDRIVDLPRTTRWEAMARAALRDDVYSEQAGLAAEVLRSGGGVERWLAENADAVGRSLQVLADIRSGGTLDLARLSVAVREIRNLIHSSGVPEPAAQPAPQPLP
ncbi:MAG TPA: NAD-glutamate dehydrogenase [Gaiellaceae bacterium]|nr:NAD-glutamate dehydrogenase [Gaiellaceae bacterium]